MLITLTTNIFRKRKRYKYKIKYAKNPIKLNYKHQCELCIFLFKKMYFLTLATVNPRTNDQPSNKSTSSTQNVVSKYHLPLKGTRLLGGQKCISGPGTCFTRKWGNYQRLLVLSKWTGANLKGPPLANDRTIWVSKNNDCNRLKQLKYI